MASYVVCARREAGFYKQVEDGVRIKAETIRPSHSEKLDTKKMYQTEVRRVYLAVFFFRDLHNGPFTAARFTTALLS